MERSVSELVERARMHDAEAFAELIQRFEGTVLAIAFAHVRSPSDAGDLCQEAFMRAWKRLDSLSDPSRFGPWISRMVKNLAIDDRRRKRALEWADSLDIVCNTLPDQPIESAEQTNDISDALSSLDDTTRACVVLRYYEDLSSKEIGPLVHLSPSAVDMRLSRARNLLKEKLQDKLLTK